MRVICIDEQPRDVYPEDCKKLKEGEEYTVMGEPRGYELAEVTTSNPVGWAKDRFVPLSDKDEREYSDEIMETMFEPVKTKAI